MKAHLGALRAALWALERVAKDSDSLLVSETGGPVDQARRSLAYLLAVLEGRR